MTHRILTVDDDLHIREVIRVALSKAGMTVFEARDGKQALARFAGDRPDLIILDIGMPELDGLDVCRQIRKSSDVPILFLTARDEEIDRILGLEMGGVGRAGDEQHVGGVVQQPGEADLRGRHAQRLGPHVVVV